MDPEFLTSRLKPTLIGSGYTLKKKYLDEICQTLKSQGHESQQKTEELVQLKQQSETISIEKQQLENRLREVTERINTVSNALHKEQKQTLAFKTECDRLSENFKALQLDFNTKQLANSEKDEKVRQMTHTLEKTVAEHQVKVYQQSEEYEKMRKQFSSEQAILKQYNQDLIRKLDSATELQEKTEELCKELESGLSASIYDFGKLEGEKLKVEEQMDKEREEHSAIIRDLASQLESAKKRELQVIDDFENYKRSNKTAHLKLKEVMFGQSKERVDTDDVASNEDQSDGNK